MPTNKQRREAARRHLERQLERRQANDVKRKKRTLIITVVASVVVVAVIVAVMIALVHDDKKTPAAAATPTASASSAGPTVQTAGPCGYTQTADKSSKDVGVPPDPSPTPTINRVLTLNSAKGPLTITLDGTNAPCTVQSIAYLAGKKFYDTTSCFRLVTAQIFVLQCGDPDNAGTGGPGYQIKDENLAKADYSPVGTVAMANGGAGTDGSQFFIIFKDSSTLPKSYTVIGHVTAGMDIVQAVAAGGVQPTPAASGSTSGATPSTDGAPVIPLAFTTVTVTPAVDGTGTLVTVAPTPGAASAPAATPSAAAS